MRIVNYVFGMCTFAAVMSAAGFDIYLQKNLVSDLPGVAAHQDPDLVNPWGIVAGPMTPFWISDNGTGLSTLYNGAGTKFPPGSPLVVTIPPPMGGTPPSAPTGVVFSGGAGFGKSAFIFDTEDGTIAAWSGGTTAALEVTSAAGSVYKGLAMGDSSMGNVLYATNFGLNRIDVFNTSFKSVSLAGSFKDSTIPAGFAPFDIKNIGGSLYVTYAKQDAAHHDDVSGLGNGFVDVFDLNGNLVRRLVSQGALNSPWGLALAPMDFGKFSNDLLVGNFGNGWINAFNPMTGAFIGTLDGSKGPVVIQGLWGLDFGNGAAGLQQPTNTLFFTAGIPGSGDVEDHGLFGSLVATPEPQSAWLIGLAGVVLVGFSLVERHRLSNASRSTRTL